MAGPLIVTAELAPPEFAWLNDLRRRHYPAERNRVPAHLTMLHAVAPSAEAERRKSGPHKPGSPASRTWAEAWPFASLRKSST